MKKHFRVMNCHGRICGTHPHLVLARESLFSCFSTNKKALIECFFVLNSKNYLLHLPFLPILCNRIAIGQYPVIENTTIITPTNTTKINQLLFTRRLKITPVNISIPATRKMIRSIYQLLVSILYIFFILIFFGKNL